MRTGACGSLFSVRGQETGGLVDGVVFSCYCHLQNLSLGIYEAEVLGGDLLGEDEEGLCHSL